MAALRSSSLLPSHRHPHHRPSSHSLKPALRLLFSSSPRKLPLPLLASSSGPPPTGDAFSSNFDLSKKPLLADLIQEIEPLDVTLIQKDVPPTTLDAMKRTISGMLGLLPSNQFQVLIEALWEPLSTLLVSSIMTGYTLRNAEYRLFLERNLGVHEADCEKKKLNNSDLILQGEVDSARINEPFAENNLFTKPENVSEEQLEGILIEELGALPPEAQQYIHQLKSRLSSAKKELHEVKRKNAALQMQQFVGEEKNELLDYLRSLQPEKVAELSEPTSPELKYTIHTVVHGLLATLSPKMHSKAPPFSGITSGGTVNVGSEDWAELVENASLQFQPQVSLSRDYLARLLFWCILLGHYLRGLEYRMELTELLSLSIDAANDPGI